MIARPHPATVSGCRAAIDEIDAVLAALLEYRAGLTERVQQLKPVGGHAGRDAGREAEIVAGMARRAPRLGPERLTRIMTTVIEESLDLAESSASRR
nr:chorismate mutase [Actinopolymorpha pittospori]